METIETPFRLGVPRSDEEALQVSGFVPASTRLIAQLAIRDGRVTPSELAALSSAAERLAGASDNALLVRVLTLRFACEPPDWSSAVGDIKRLAKDATPDARAAVLGAAEPILRCQGSAGRGLARELASALAVDRATTTKFIESLPPGAERGWWGMLSRAWGEPSAVPADRLGEARHLAAVLDDRALAKVADDLAEAEAGPIRDRALHEAIVQAGMRAVVQAESLLPSIESLARHEQDTDRFLRLSNALVSQLEQRLESISDRLKFQRDLFQRDLNAFLDGRATEVERDMLELVGRTEADWSDAEVWKRFAESHVATKVKRDYQQLKVRYDEMMALWQTEVERFDNELQYTAKAILDHVDDRTFVSLLDTEHMSARFLSGLDRAADVTIKAAAATAGVGGVAFATGILSAAATLVGGTALAPAVGVGIAVGGATVGAAFLWKRYSRPEDRKRELIRDKRGQFRESLLRLLGEPVAKHDEALEEIGRLFVDAATRRYAPLVRDAHLAVAQARIETLLIRRVVSDTRSAFAQKAG